MLAPQKNIPIDEPETLDNDFSSLNNILQERFGFTVPHGYEQEYNEILCQDENNLAEAGWEVERIWTQGKVFLTTSIIEHARLGIMNNIFKLYLSYNSYGDPQVYILKKTKSGHNAPVEKQSDASSQKLVTILNPNN